MSKLIDAEKLDFVSYQGIPDGYKDSFDSGVLYAMNLIDDQPTIDAAEVVRCKDCKHRPYEDAYCNPVFTDDVCPCQCSEDPYYGWNPPADWFCPKGEKGTK